MLVLSSKESQIDKYLPYPALPYLLILGLRPSLQCVERQRYVYHRA